MKLSERPLVGVEQRRERRRRRRVVARVLAGMHSSTQAQMQQQAIAAQRLAAQLERLSRAVVSGDGATAEILSGSRPITPTAIEVEARISTRAAGGPGKSPLGP